MAGAEGGGAALVAAVGVLGTGLLTLGYQLRAAHGRLASLARDAAAARRQAAEAEGWATRAGPVLAAERGAGEVLARVDDLDEVRAAIGAILDRAEEVRAA